MDFNSFGTERTFAYCSIERLNRASSWSFTKTSSYLASCEIVFLMIHLALSIERWLMTGGQTDRHVDTETTYSEPFVVQNGKNGTDLLSESELR